MLFMFQDVHLLRAVLRRAAGRWSRPALLEDLPTADEVSALPTGPGSGGSLSASDRLVGRSIP